MSGADLVRTIIRWGGGGIPPMMTVVSHRRDLADLDEPYRTLVERERRLCIDSVEY